MAAFSYLRVSGLAPDAAPYCITEGQSTSIRTIGLSLVGLSYPDDPAHRGACAVGAHLPGGLNAIQCGHDQQD